MPDPPTNEPTEEGQRPNKMQKMTQTASAGAGTSDSGDTGTSDAEWETVEKTKYSDVNGYVDVVDERRSTSIDEDAMTQEEKEQHTNALHTAQLGGDPPQNALERDW